MSDKFVNPSVFTHTKKTHKKFISLGSYENGPKVYKETQFLLTNDKWRHELSKLAEKIASSIPLRQLVICYAL